MHFCVSAARVSLAGRAPAHLETSAPRSPRKIGTNWFMPAFVNSSPGESGSNDDDGTIVCPCRAKKSRKLWRISAEVMTGLVPVRDHAPEDKEARTQRRRTGLA